MIVKTARFGDIEIEEEKIIKMPEGIFGFPDQKRFFIMNHKDTPFKWLQSLDDPSLAFVIMNPIIFEPNYHINIPKSEVACLDIFEEKDALVMVIISIPKDPSKMTANLQGPLVINTKKMLAKQLILSDGKYTTRHYIFPQLKKNVVSDNR